MALLNQAVRSRPKPQNAIQINKYCIHCMEDTAHFSIQRLALTTEIQLLTMYVSYDWFRPIVLISVRGFQPKNCAQIGQSRIDD